LKLAILETGGPPPALAPRFGAYAPMFEAMLTKAGLVAEYCAFDVRAGDLPARAEAFDGMLITGSSAGVYDDLPWIEPLLEFLRRARGQTRLVGVCFGHQALAKAFGGVVTRSERGWGVGLHTYRVQQRASWMGEDRDVAIAVSHQDQVISPPAEAQVLAGSDFTPFGVLSYPQAGALSCQFHPEFSPDYAAALIESRRGGVLSDAEADAALQSLKAPNDRDRVAAWLRGFIESDPAPQG